MSVKIPAGKMILGKLQWEKSTWEKIIQNISNFKCRIVEIKMLPEIKILDNFLPDHLKQVVWISI